MVATPEIRAPQAGVIAAVRQAAQEIRAPQVNVMVAYNIPAEEIRSTFGGVNAVFRQTSVIRATHGTLMAVVKGTVATPKLKAWTFTLDGHDFYVLKLGTGGKTLIYDLSTGQWSWWTSGSRPNWRLNLGLNWRSAGGVPSNYGSNVVVGDDTTGTLWVLDPEQGQDDSDLTDGELVTFPRVATGQMVTKTRQFLPVFSVQLRGSQGQPALTANTVTLSYSDDAGQTFVDADEPIVVLSGDYEQEYDWKSLGMVRAPGRLFRISDDGSFARIDSLDVNE